VLHFNVDSVFYLYALAASIAFTAARLNYLRRNEIGLSRLVVVFTLIGLWSVSTGLEYFFPRLETKLTFHVISIALTNILTVHFILFLLEFFQIKWFTYGWKIALLIFTSCSLLLEWTNPLHHQIWTQISLAPGQDSVLEFTIGPLFLWDFAYGTGMALFCLGLIVYEAVRKRGWQRLRAIFLGLSLLVAYLSYFNNQIQNLAPLRINLMPIGFSLSCLLITWIVFKDLQLTYVAQASMLRKNILELQGEVDNRKNVEKLLLETQESMSLRIAEQTQKLTGLYEMIVLAGQQLPRQQVLDQSLERICSTLNCDLVVYFDPLFTQPLSASARLPSFDSKRLGELSFEWATTDQMVVCTQGEGSTELPEDVRRAGYLTCAGMRVRILDQSLGILACFWEVPHTFRVDEISLLGAVAEELGVVLENAHLRELTSLTATQDERKRLARDLHDSVVQSLHSLVFTADNASIAANTHPEKLYPILDHLSASASLALKELRLMLYQLRLVSSSEIHFHEAVQLRLEAVERRSNVEAEFLVEAGASWHPLWEHDLYIITMEALNNALKYAQARRVSVHVRGGGGHDFELLISDNGKGFDPAAVRDESAGFMMMTDLAKSLGGRLEITSTPGAGTTVCLRVAAAAV
jgi:signal transduction histidine kinase